MCHYVYVMSENVVVEFFFGVTENNTNTTTITHYCLTKLNVFDLHLARYKIMRGPSLLPGGGGLREIIGCLMME